MPEFDQLGRVGYTTREMVDLLYTNPDLDLGNFEVIDPKEYNHSNEFLRTDFPTIQEFIELKHLTQGEYDSIAQSK